MHPRNFGRNKIVSPHVILVCPFISGTLRFNDADGKENVKKNNKFYKRNDNFARTSRFSVNFFARFCTTAT